MTGKEKEPGRDKVIGVLEEWAEKHNKPEQKTLDVGEKTYTPRQIVDEIKNESEIGNKLYEDFMILYREQGNFDFLDNI